MHERFEKVKDRVKAIMDNMFVGYRYSFEEDPEDSSVIYVNLFDVDPENVQDFKKLIRKEIRDVFECEDILFVPSIFTADETRKCYGEQYMRHADSIAALTERSSLAPSVVEQLREMELRCFPGEGCGRREAHCSSWSHFPHILNVIKEIDTNARDEERDAA